VPVRHAVILAGGSGTRLWPASRRAMPKQLLPLGPHDETLLASAVRRAYVLADHQVVVTADAQLAATREVVVDPAVTVLGEPVPRNTAAAIALAAATIIRRDPDAVLVVMPADQYVADVDGLRRAVDRLVATVADHDGIGVLGIRPTRAETGFGYLELAGPADADVVAVVRFVEKPDRADAERYFASGYHAWNAGWFVATARRLLAELDSFLPMTAEAARAIAADPARAPALYPALKAISIDHAVMERTAAPIACAPVDVGWDDIGSWAAIAKLYVPDAAGNTRAADHVVIVDGRNNIIVSDDATVIAAVGVSDLVIVKAGDAVLVVPRDRAQDVREVVAALSARGLQRYL
jgi:mannose-1-phosphate guanylyltransferase